MMSKIQVLDCTLRDGGYCNNCKFGFDNEKKIVHGLVEANIDIIECGFLMNTVEYDKDFTRFTSLDEVAKIIPQNKEGKTFVMLTDYGKYCPEDLPEYNGTSVDGLRVAFHKKDRVAALEECKAIKNKGYKVFVQAMVSLSYTDEEFLDLIRRVNELEPYAFYIVDSFGMMKRKDLIRLFYLVEHNLNENIKIGFHSHNNMQLAYSNAQSLMNLHSDRELIIDASVYGMGRGAGNLNTELFVQYLNDNADSNYDIKPLLSIIDEILNEFYQRNYWGYSLPNYLSAAHNAHPNYAGYLDDKKTLTVENMNEIFDMMDEDKKVSYDKNYIEELYLRYMATSLFVSYLQTGRCDTLKECMNKFDDDSAFYQLKGEIEEIIREIGEMKQRLSRELSFTRQCLNDDLENVELLVQKNQTQIEQISYNQETQRLLLATAFLEEQ